jgi:hypothetical protein
MQIYLNSAETAETSRVNFELWSDLYCWSTSTEDTRESQLLLPNPWHIQKAPFLVVVVVAVVVGDVDAVLMLVFERQRVPNSGAPDQVNISSMQDTHFCSGR